MGSEKPSKSEEEPGRLLGSAQLCVCGGGLDDLARDKAMLNHRWRPEMEAGAYSQV